MKNGTLIVNNIRGQVNIVTFGDTDAISAALVMAGKTNPNLANAISSAAIELDDYSEALKTSEVLRKIIDNETK